MTVNDIHDLARFQRRINPGWHTNNRRNGASWFSRFGGIAKTYNFEDLDLAEFHNRAVAKRVKF